MAVHVPHAPHRDSTQFCGQLWALHKRDCVSGQGWPLNMAGTWMAGWRCWAPEPHDFVQVDHGAHWNWQITGHSMAWQL